MWEDSMRWMPPWHPALTEGKWQKLPGHPRHALATACTCGKLRWARAALPLSDRGMVCRGTTCFVLWTVTIFLVCWDELTGCRNRDKEEDEHIALEQSGAGQRRVVILLFCGLLESTQSTAVENLTDPHSSTWSSTFTEEVWSSQMNFSSFTTL